MNRPPGEIFILNHLNTISKAFSDLELNIAYGATSHYGKITSPLKSNINAFAIPNFDRLSRLNKAMHVLKYPFIKRSNLKNFALEQFFKRQKADIVHFHFASTAIKWYNYLPPKSSFTFSIRGSDINVMPITKSTYLDNLKKVTDKADGIHVVNEELADRFNALVPGFESKIKIIPTVVAKDFFNINNTPRNNYFIAIGRLHWIKGHRDLILACHSLKKKIPDFLLEIIGEGEERQVLEYMIRDLNLTKNIKLSGNLDPKEIRAKLSRCAFIVQSSLDEGFPNSIGEAMAAGVPIVSTNCGGIGKILTKNSAFLSEPGEPGQLFENLENACKNNFERKNWVMKNKETAQNLFSEKRHSEQFSEFWDLHG